MIVEIRVILNVKVLISIRYDININGVGFALLLIVHSFLILILPLLLGIISGEVLLHFLIGEG
jgi:hypothetical protein